MIADRYESTLLAFLRDLTVRDEPFDALNSRGRDQGSTLSQNAPVVVRTTPSCDATERIEQTR